MRQSKLLRSVLLTFLILSVAAPRAAGGGFSGGKRERVSSAGDKAERAAKRQALGPLCDLVVTPSTLAKYQTSLTMFFAWLESWDIPVPRDFWTLDETVAEYVNFLWMDGESKTHANNLISGVQHSIPRTRGELKTAWRWLSAWDRAELPARAPPLSPRMTLGMAGGALRSGWPDVAALIMLGFTCFLRTGELLSLTVGSLEFLRNRLVVRLGRTKTSKNAEEAVFCEDSTVIRFLRRFCAGKPKTERLLQRTQAEFRRLFSLLRDMFDLDDRILPYSLRRGGASWFFKKTASMEQALLRGRWAASRSARVYIMDASAEAIKLSLSAASERLLAAAAKAIALYVKSVA